jgi:hypothetical protein
MHQMIFILTFKVNITIAIHQEHFESFLLNLIIKLSPGANKLNVYYFSCKPAIFFNLLHINMLRILRKHPDNILMIAMYEILNYPATGAILNSTSDLILLTLLHHFQCS